MFFRESRLRRKYGTPIIVVSGLPRSGTSMMMKMLEAGGAEIVTDAIRSADEDNPKGYFELERVKELDKTDDKAWVQDCRGKVVKVISFLLRDLPDDNYYKVLFMRRHFDEIMASQHKMEVRRGEAGTDADRSGDAAMIQNYKIHLKKTEFLLSEQENFRALDVDYRGVLDSPAEHARRVRRFLGMDLDVRQMVGVVDKALYRNRA
jgi:hypothetical protein